MSKATGSEISGRGVVLDSFALLAFLGDETGAEEVAALLEAADAERPVLMSYVNLGEVLYITERSRGPGAVDQVLGAVDQLPIDLVEAGRLQTIAAARLKARFPLSYADAMCAALGELAGLPVITGDPEFRAVEGRIQVLWLGEREG
ncbi:MAG: type II toxin-antitoxin system VapC family toxin [Thermoleophilia bacterium]|nr:type II toxin-antitoxin system VapC family toxin [Actinomycetota bacterium]